jgi:site-specific DNA-cytosine methylase
MEASLVRFRGLVRGMDTREAIERRYEPRLSHNSVQDDTYVNEHQTLAQLVPSLLQTYGHHYEYIVLNNFAVYDQFQFEGKGFGGQLRSLFTDSSEKSPALMSGTLQDTHTSIDCHDMIINESSLSGLLDRSSPTTVVFINTKTGSRQGIRYRLGVPAPAYVSIFRDFKWVADFAKFVLHFLHASSSEKVSVKLDGFRQRFWNFLVRYYGNDDHGSAHLTAWWDECGHTEDFRTHFARYGQFIHRLCESSAHGDHTINDLLDHSVWDDIAIGRAMQQAKRTEKALKEEKTVVTAVIGRSFTMAFPSWGDGPGLFNLLDTLKPSPEVIAARSARMYLFDDKEPRPGAISAQKLLENASSLSNFGLRYGSEVLGTVLVVRHNGEPRLAYARNVRDRDNQTLEVVWLAQAQNTICGSLEADGTHYRVQNELFFVDECNCTPVPFRNIMASYLCEVFATSHDNLFIKGLYRRDALEHVTANGQLLERGHCPEHSQSSTSSQVAEPVDDGTDSVEINTMGLFCGCGTVDHSLGFKTVLAVDVNAAALASHKANNANKDCRYHLQSTNTLLKDIACGREPYPNIDCLVAGCPCKGFSNCNQYKQNVQAHRNCSMLANTLSFVDLLRPKYVLIENVPAMNSSDVTKDRANACKQAICELKRMDYQVAFHTVSGTDVNGPSIRTRLFIIAAAPNLKLPKKPFVNTDGVISITAGDVLSDLTQLVSNDTILNMKTPDHVPIERLQNDFDNEISLVDVISRIPRTGPVNRRNLYGANRAGALSDHQSHWFSRQTNEKQQPSSKSLQRLDPDSPFPTITSTLVPMNSRGSACIHPEQDRTVTMLELRRGQGIPDDFLLIGTIKEAREQIGNGVVWQVGQAWGKSIARAWFESGLGPDSSTGSRGSGAAGTSTTANTNAHGDRGARSPGPGTSIDAGLTLLDGGPLFGAGLAYGTNTAYGADSGNNANPGYNTNTGRRTNHGYEASSGYGSQSGYCEQSSCGTKSRNKARPATSAAADSGVGTRSTPRAASTSNNTPRTRYTGLSGSLDTTHQPGSRKRRRLVIEISSDEDKD